MNRIFIVLIVLAVSCNNDPATKAKDEQESYQALKENILEKEQKNPENFLSIKGNNKKNLLGQTVVKGIIVNHATVATYKDVDIKLTFYSKTKALLETDKETIFEVLLPGESKSFKTKYFAPKGTDSVALEIMSGKIVQEQNESK